MRPAIALAAQAHELILKLCDHIFGQRIPGPCKGLADDRLHVRAGEIVQLRVEGALKWLGKIQPRVLLGPARFECIDQAKFRMPGCSVEEPQKWLPILVPLGRSQFVHDLLELVEREDQPHGPRRVPFELRHHGLGGIHRGACAGPADGTPLRG